MHSFKTCLVTAESKWTSFASAQHRGRLSGNLTTTTIHCSWISVRQNRAFSVFSWPEINRTKIFQPLLAPIPFTGGQIFCFVLIWSGWKVTRFVKNDSKWNKFVPKIGPKWVALHMYWRQTEPNLIIVMWSFTIVDGLGLKFVPLSICGSWEAATLC